jgi:hypothetical protein
MLTWPLVEKLAGSWCCSLPPSTPCPLMIAKISYFYHHHSLLLTTSLPCSTHHSKRRKRGPHWFLVS